MSPQRRLFAAALLTVAALLPSARPAAATIGPYTLPFFSWSGVSLTQDYGPSSCDCAAGHCCEHAGHGYAHWHSGLDYGMAIGTNIASTVAGTVVRLKEDLADFTADQYGQGNYIQLQSSSTRFETYYHLTQNGALLAVGDKASAGQHIAESGSTGNSTGPHLHYELDTQLTCADNTCDIDPRAWTTSPGRVPWQTQFYSERATGVVNGTFYFDQGTTASWWVKFKNTGGRTWTNTNDSNGKTRMVLYATNGASSPASISNSPFIASDWLANNLPTAMDETSVAPDAIGTFSFSLHSPPSFGSYPHNYFNINAQGIMYLKQTNASPNQYPYDVPIYVNCTVAPCPNSPVGP